MAAASAGTGSSFVSSFVFWSDTTFSNDLPGGDVVDIDPFVPRRSLPAGPSVELQALPKEDFGVNGAL